MLSCKSVVNCLLKHFYSLQLVNRDVQSVTYFKYVSNTVTNKLSDEMTKKQNMTKVCNMFIISIYTAALLCNASKGDVEYR